MSYVIASAKAAALAIAARYLPRKEIISMEGKESGEMFHTRTEQTNETISCVTERKATTSLNTGHVTFTGEDIEQLPADFVSVHCSTAVRLDLSYNKLRSLDGVEKFVKLEELILDNNQLTDSSISALPSLPNLLTLTLNNNNISDIDLLLTSLGSVCPRLRYLSLLGNQACPHEMLGGEHDDEDYQRYRYYVLYKMPKLTFLDSRTVTSVERSEAKRKGEFTKVVRPTSNVFEESSNKPDNSSHYYTPLPQSAPVAGQHRAVFGQCKYVYYGKHSEGNRFIRNNQL